MKQDHSQMNQYLSEYVAGSLPVDLVEKVDSHLSSCQECRKDLKLWKAVSQTIQELESQVKAPTNLAVRAMRQIESSSSKGDIFQRAWNILRSQLPIIKREIWPATAATMAIGYFAAMLAGKPEGIRIFAPLIAAASISILYGPENDGAEELALSTPTSPRQILLARVVLVFGYNLILAGIATLAIAPFFDAIQLYPFILSWLAPMTFLSSLALLLSLVIGTGNAIAFAYGAWLIQFLYPGLKIVNDLPAYFRLADGLSYYTAFWHQPAWMLFAAFGLITLALWVTPRVGFRQSSLA